MVELVGIAIRWPPIVWQLAGKREMLKQRLGVGDLSAGGTQHGHQCMKWPLELRLSGCRITRIEQRSQHLFDVATGARIGGRHRGYKRGGRAVSIEPLAHFGCEELSR